MRQIYLLTGKPGSGKTSLIKQVVAELQLRAGGFYTEEIRSKGTRLGFKLITLDGQETVLAHVDIKSRYRVSRYGVDVESLDRVGVPTLYQAAAQDNLIVIDEIGKMELFSLKFRQAVLDVIESGKRMLGTVMLNPNPWADAIKRKPQVKVVELTRENRQPVLEDLRHWLQEMKHQGR